MHSFRKMLKPWDIILIILISISSFSPVGIAAWKASVKSDSNKMTEVIAVVKIDGKIVDEFNLTTTKNRLRKLITRPKRNITLLKLLLEKFELKKITAQTKLQFVLVGLVDQVIRVSVFPINLLLKY